MIKIQIINKLSNFYGCIFLADMSERGGFTIISKDWKINYMFFKGEDVKII